MLDGSLQCCGTEWCKLVFQWGQIVVLSGLVSVSHNTDLCLVTSQMPQQKQCKNSLPSYVSFGIEWCLHFKRCRTQCRLTPKVAFVRVVINERREYTTSISALFYAEHGSSVTVNKALIQSNIRHYLLRLDFLRNKAVSKFLLSVQTWSCWRAPSVCPTSFMNQTNLCWPSVWPWPT